MNHVRSDLNSCWSETPTANNMYRLTEPTLSGSVAPSSQMIREVIKRDERFKVFVSVDVNVPWCQLCSAASGLCVPSG